MTQPPVNVGANEWLVDEMYREYLANPASVSPSWQEFFVDYRPAHAAADGAKPASTDGAKPASTAAAGTATSSTPAAPAPSPKPTSESAPELPDGAEPLRGVAARIVENMEKSLEVPTATSFRDIPARLLEVNRTIINGHLGRTRGGKVSFTHLIGYAVVRAIADTVPAMNNGYATDENDKPIIVRRKNVGLGIAIDVEKKDGSRSLVVPCIKDANLYDFAGFVDLYDDLVRRGRENKLTIDDFAGVTVSLTNPGGLGTVQSVPRLMPGQGAIIGLGSIAYPTAFAAADPAKLAEIGVSKVVTVTSTYDHRIIQGAESGMFLRRVEQLLIGEDGFYDQAFDSMAVPYDAVKWRRDVNPTDSVDAALERQGKVNHMINNYRVRGHLIANLDPLGLMDREMHPELDPASYGLTIWDLEREFLVEGELGPAASKGRSRMKLGEILGVMRDAYARTIGVEYMHIANPDEKRWIQDNVEGQPFTLDSATQHHILSRLNAAEALEKFLGTKYIGQKRFGIDGAESLIPALDRVLSAAADADLQNAVIGMAHRGRLNVLVNIVGKAYHQLFEEFEGGVTADLVQGSGDVKYHLGQRGVFTSPAGNSIEVDLAANPSHLEAVDPVVVGMARAKMDRLEHSDVRYPILPVLIHGDAAFAGQGVVTETLNLSQIRGYKVGGTIHLIVNNQLGFTTAPHAARSSEYSTDVAKLVQAPIFHVNADDPEACVRVSQLAFDYRQEFNKDVVIDIIGYRRFGHNEGDDPSYTQPLMYKAIENRRSVRKLYTEALIKRGDLTVDEAEAALDDFRSRLQEALDSTRAVESDPDAVPAPPRESVGVLPPADTAVTREAIDEVYAALTDVPDWFTVHPKLADQFAARDAMFADGQVDWALGEALAFGTLLREGTSVRLAGQDSRRGTFSHRHSTLVDFETGAEIQPIAGAARDGARLWVYDSLLSEYAALGFEYGYSVERPEVLTLWEAQFGDFVNGAQIVIDQFLMAAEDKWDQHCGLVMLLPHGYEGQGPEHSSARVERFLLLAAEDNVQIANVTTAAQFFHLLRRQMHRDVRKPLVVFTPKSLLRAKTTRSPVSELIDGRFRETLPDPNPPADTAGVTDLIFATGKVAVDAMARRDQIGSTAAVITRVEQLYPWPAEQVAEVVAAHPGANRIIWLQEEPENMGAWNFVKGRLYEMHGETHTIQRISRHESGSPSTGSASVHKHEQRLLLEAALPEG